MGEKKKSTFKRTHTMSSQKTTRRSWRDEDRGMELAQRRRRNGAGTTKIAVTEATAWLNRGAESIGTLNFRRSWRDKDCGTELARRRSLQRRLRHGLIAERNTLKLGFEWKGKILIWEGTHKFIREECIAICGGHKPPKKIKNPLNCWLL